MKNLFNKNLNDYLYFFTPPIIYQFLSKTLAKKHIKNNPETDKMKLSLDSFRKEKFNYFFAKIVRKSHIFPQTNEFCCLTGPAI